MTSVERRVLRGLPRPVVPSRGPASRFSRSAAFLGDSGPLGVPYCLLGRPGRSAAFLTRLRAFCEPVPGVGVGEMTHLQAWLIYLAIVAVSFAVPFAGRFSWGAGVRTGALACALAAGSSGSWSAYWPPRRLTAGAPRCAVKRARRRVGLFRSGSGGCAGALACPGGFALCCPAPGLDVADIASCGLLGASGTLGAPFYSLPGVQAALLRS